MDRQLASIQRIVDIQPIEGADSIEVATVLGWKAVVRKGAFLINDLVVYVETDSLIPRKEWSEFLFKDNRERFHLKTVRLRGQISQGLILSIEQISTSVRTFLPFKEGDDITYQLNITKYEPEVSGSLAGVCKSTFPSWIPKTDETRIQSRPSLLETMKWKRVYVSEKCDGSSTTFYIKDGIFGVCSRKLDLIETEDNAYWKCARKENIESKLKLIAENLNIKNIAIQGELLGPKVNGNKYKLTNYEFRAFNLFNIDGQKYYNIDILETRCNRYELKTVPIIEFLDLEDDVDYWVNKSISTSVINPLVLREGIVVRGVEEEYIDRWGRFSFKVINPEFLLRYKE